MKKSNTVFSLYGGTFMLTDSNDYNCEKSLLWLFLSMIKGISEVKLNHLARSNNFSPEKVKEEIERLNQEREESKKYAFPKWDEVKYRWQLYSQKYQILTISNSNYPQQLFDLEEPPSILYCRGSGTLNFNNGVAVVGSRNADGYGQAMALELSSSLAEHGLTIVSGLALGIDTCAHRGALEGKGQTIAAMGCGINICYPSANKKLSQAIAENGLVISEYPENFQPRPYNFPYRNRIIAALSRAVIVVQAHYKSGAMITANIAADLGRQVLAVPGPINNRQSEGPLELIANGAGLVRHSLDVLDSLGVLLSAPASSTDLPKDNLSKLELSILASLDTSGTDTSTIALRTACPLGHLVAALNKLEINGKIIRLSNSLWVRKSQIEPKIKTQAELF